MSVVPLDFEKPIIEIEKQLEALRDQAGEEETNPEIAAVEQKLADKREEIYSGLSPWDRVKIARHTARPFMLDYVEHCFDDFLELHGDRHIGDDSAMPGGFGTIGGQRCVVVGHQKGRNTKENLHRNFGSAHPEGYRKALRLMKQAEKYGLPVVSLIDTPGAFPGIGAEERNIAEAIAFNLREMAALKTPVIAVVIGEGGSGGALGIGIADHVIMLENAYYSVISPEGCAAILWKDRKFAAEAAESLRLTAQPLKELGVIDEVVPEPLGGAHRDPITTAASLKESILKAIEDLQKLSIEDLRERRYQRLRSYGEVG